MSAPDGEQTLFDLSGDAEKTAHISSGPGGELEPGAERGPGGDDVSRFKGLGEMPWQHLQSTCFDPATRKLQQVTVEDVGEVSATLTLIMGNGPAAAGKRRSWLADVGLAVPS